MDAAEVRPFRQAETCVRYPSIGRVTGQPKIMAIAWLADAPLFLDAEQVSAFYDAVLLPDSKQKSIEFTVSEEAIAKFSIEAGGQAEANFGGWLQTLFGIGIKAGVTGKAVGEKSDKEGSSHSVTLEPIDNPYRQLLHLALHYGSMPERLFVKTGATLADEDWRSPEAISKLPRGLVFIEFPNWLECQNFGLPRTKLIPMAAEFEGNGVELIYKLLKDGENEPPTYPDEGTSAEETRNARKAYWAWFDEHFNDTRSMIAIEKAASGKGRMLWIDFRVPLSNEGDSLHLHICPRGDYDVGTFAYNLVKRGYKHGLRLVGTLKAEPDLNVLAVFER